MAKAKDFLQKVKEKLSLGNLVEENEKGVVGGNVNIPYIAEAKREFIFEDAFSVMFSDEPFILPRYITHLEINEKERAITLRAEVTRETHYYGKPSEYTNVFSVDEMDKMVSDFNSNMRYIDVSEYVSYPGETEEDEPVLKNVITTRYHRPFIDSYKTCFDVDRSNKKSWTFAILFDHSENIKIQSEEVTDGE